ncbi:formyl-CoA transferase [Pollutimonas subterranea]|uniref:Formyl-CoA transferase n=2 Tax=Pollutimonas subterranea TaxID=2045210 RepID=A0A2N4U723_9BURK|nr:formyl-CoA transferase [Pollutimonas subterranea]
MTNPKPLHNIKIVDFSRVFAGPYCSMLLADLGAEVIKVEVPVDGDPLRRQGPPFHHGIGLTFLAANRNKKSLTLDLKSKEGRDIAISLCSQADVVLENFRPDVMARLGLDYATLSGLNPGLIYACISGLGADGPDMLQGAFDLTIQAIGGYMSITGEQDGPPIKLGTSAFDMVTGMNCQAAILAALYQRTFTGQGQKIETSLLESEVAFLANAALEYLITGQQPKKMGSEHAQQVPYKAFKASDGWIVIGAAYQNLYEAFMSVLGRNDLVSDQRFRTLENRICNRKDLYMEIDKEVVQYKIADLMSELNKAKVPCSPVNNIEQVFSHRQVLHRNMHSSVSHEMYGLLPQVGPAVKYSAFDVGAGWQAPPLLGEQSAEILTEWLNMTEAEIDSLRSRQVI